MKPAIIVLILVSVFLASTLLVRDDKQAEQQKAPLETFSLPDISGALTPISNWQGKILIINFWATWCPPCLKEIPGFIELQAEYASKNVQFIGIAIDDVQLVEDYLSFIDINYPILIAKTEGEQLAQKLGNIMNAIPFTVIVNQQSQIVFRHPGELSKQRIRELLKPLLSTKPVTDAAHG